MITKYSVGFHKEGKELYILIMFNCNQSEMEEFLRNKMGIEQAINTTMFDFLSKYRQLDGSMFFQTLYSYDYIFYKSSIIQIKGENFRVQFRVKEEDCINLNLEELLNKLEGNELKYAVFLSDSEDYNKAIYI